MSIFEQYGAFNVKMSNVVTSLWSTQQNRVSENQGVDKHTKDKIRNTQTDRHNIECKPQ